MRFAIVIWNQPRDRGAMRAKMQFPRININRRVSHCSRDESFRWKFPRTLLISVVSRKFARGGKRERNIVAALAILEIPRGSFPATLAFAIMSGWFLIVSRDRRLQGTTSTRGILLDFGCNWRARYLRVGPRKRCDALLHAHTYIYRSVVRKQSYFGIKNVITWVWMAASQKSRDESGEHAGEGNKRKRAFFRRKNTPPPPLFVRKRVQKTYLRKKRGK